jgi:hypothetical protein
MSSGDVSDIANQPLMTSRPEEFHGESLTGTESSASLSSRPRPNLSSLDGSRSDTRANAVYCTRNLKGNFKVGMRTEKISAPAQPFVTAGAHAANTTSYDQ